MAGQGSVLFADAHKADMMAELTAKRDAVLNANRQAAATQAQDFTLQRDASALTAKQAAVTSAQDFTLKRDETALAAQKAAVATASETALDKQDDRQLDALERIQVQHELNVKRDAAKPSTTKSTAMTSAQKLSMVSSIMKQIREEQDSYDILPKDKLDKAGIKALAITRMNEVMELAFPDITPGASFNPKNVSKLPEISSQREYDLLQSGQSYFNTKSGIQGTKQ